MLTRCGVWRKQLASILSTGTCKNLEGLDVSCNEMGAIGASALAAALRTNHVLKTLDLSTNALGDQGVIALAEALQLNSSLTYLDVHACGIYNKGATVPTSPFFPLPCTFVRMRYQSESAYTMLQQAKRANTKSS